MDQLFVEIEPRLFLLLVLLGVGLFLAGVVVCLLALRAFTRYNGERARRRGRQAERRALRLLEKEGYLLVEREPVFQCELLVDGQARSFEIRPDFLVEKDDQAFVVEVKSGANQSGVSSASARRQVIEYLLATGCACLLVNMADGTIEMVELSPEGWRLALDSDKT